jgi:prefoldin beta subunit
LAQPGVAEVSETLRAEVKRYQDLVEKLRLVATNRQQLQLQLAEVNEALKELGSVDDSAPVYKVAGSIIVAKKKNDVLNELNSLKESLEIRIKTLEKQEELLKKQLEELEKKLARKLGGGSQTGAG